MNIELRKWSVEDKEVLIKMCNSIDRSFLSDRLPKETLINNDILSSNQLLQNFFSCYIN